MATIYFCRFFRATRIVSYHSCTLQSADKKLRC